MIFLTPQQSQNHSDFQKKCIYTLAKKILYAKLAYCDYPNKNFENPDLRIIKI